MNTSTRLLPLSRSACAAALLTASASICAATSAPPAPQEDIRQLREELAGLRQAYEARIQALEQRLADAEARAGAAGATASREAASPAGTTSAAPAPASARAGGAAADTTARRFNPDVTLILTGGYQHLSRDPEGWRLPGFVPAEETGPGERGFNLGETELSIAAYIDPLFYGSMTVALTRENEVELEEAYVQTTGLGQGLTLKAGRFFSGLGYLNEQHAHTWDFADAPLAYQAFLGNQYAQEGLQAKWLLPTDVFAELGAEAGRGSAFPGSDASRHRAGSSALFGHVGGDIGRSHAWRAGVSLLWTHPQDRSHEDDDVLGNAVTNSFSGSSRIWVLDGVWKWAPDGNASRTSVKLQGEYFRRTERGHLLYDVDNVGGLSAEARYRSAQSGWYVQGVYQFMPRWRVGLRAEQLDSGTVDYGDNAAYLEAIDYRPRKLSAMLDWSPSEFSRVRLQLANDRSRTGRSDQQLILQYQMSLGAHGAHAF